MQSQSGVPQVSSEFVAFFLLLLFFIRMLDILPQLTDRRHVGAVLLCMQFKITCYLL